MPYRTLPRSEPDDTRPPFPDLDLVAVAAIVWLSSLVRMAAAVSRAETFGAEPTLALLAVVALPLLVVSSITSWRRGAR